MLSRKELRKVFHKPDTISFRGRKLRVWDRNYWIAQAILVTIPMKMYYRKFQIKGWENVPDNKPVLFAISHRNAFMDSLAFVNAKSTQVFQLARGDAFNNRWTQKLFHFFHMLPIWRERDGVDTKEMNQPTFNACADILAHNGMVGIYPEGNCVNEEHIRPLKKGICRIAFLAEERYDYELDVHIIPVGINYSHAENFKEWQLMNIGTPILLKKYSELYRSNPAQAVNQLKDEIENGMKQVALHVEHSHYHKDIVRLAKMYGRYEVLAKGEKYDPASKFAAEQEIIAPLEKLNIESPEAMQALSHDLHSYRSMMKHHHFRENTFDKDRSHPFSIAFMALYFIFFLPVFLYGLIINFIPYYIPQRYVEKKVKQKIFWSSAKYVIGVMLFPIWHLALMLLIWISLGSLVSALVFLISFPIAGNIAYYYWLDLKKWRSALRYRRLSRTGDPSILKLTELRKSIMLRLFALKSDQRA